MRPEFDDQDAIILERRQSKLAAKTAPQIGDFVQFANGVLRRISHIWNDEDPGIQTSANGSYYLGDFHNDPDWPEEDDCYVLCSGEMYRSIPASTLILTEERKEARFWFSHHDYQGRDNGVYVTIPRPVWQCSQEAPRS